MTKIREVSVQQINAALNDVSRALENKIKEMDRLYNEINSLKSDLDKLTKAVNGDFTELDEAIGDNLNYINNNFVPNTRTVNGKALSQNITLDASDVGALPSTTVIPAAQVNSDWNATSGVAEILNKPTIPTKTSQLTNDSSFTTNSSVSSTFGLNATKTDNAIARWDGTGGKLQNSDVTIDDSNNVSTGATVTSSQKNDSSWWTSTSPRGKFRGTNGGSTSGWSPLLAGKTVSGKYEFGSLNNTVYLNYYKDNRTSNGIDKTIFDYTQDGTPNWNGTATTAKHVPTSKPDDANGAIWVV